MEPNTGQAPPQGDEDTSRGTAEASGPATAMPSRRAAILRSGFILLVLFIVFGLILPRFVDYREVAEALAALTPPQIAVMTVLGVVAWFVCGQLFTVLIRGLSPIRGNAAYLILSGIGSSIPFGPWNMGVVWVVFRGWGISAQEATSGVALYGIIATLGRFALPLFAVIVVAATGELFGARRSVLVISLLSIVIFFVAAGVMLAVVRSQRAADTIGRVVGDGVVWTLAKLGRPERPDVDGAIHRFQLGVGEIVRRRGLLALGVNLLAQVPWIVSFVVALRFTGVPEEVLPASGIIAVFALVAVITIIPIAPGGAGVPELLYIAGLSSIAGESWEAAITAGVFLFRLYVWFLPIPLAWILLKVARRGRPMLPTAVELRSYAATGA
ncbi:MAG TPA: hypothetical protein VFO05_02430 [Candidatus Limnocylindrales bacterium]|nr:hypothetical protein [Candidatus Limnocylindrales bacterium]